jgi:hypothetical protein
MKAARDDPHVAPRLGEHERTLEAHEVLRDRTRISPLTLYAAWRHQPLFSISTQRPK